MLPCVGLYKFSCGFLSRITCVPAAHKNLKKLNKNLLKPRQAQHILPTFPPMKVISEDVYCAFNYTRIFANSPTNVNSPWYKNIGPFNYESDPVESTKKLHCKAINNTMRSFGLVPQELKNSLSWDNIFHKQSKEEKIQKIIDWLEWAEWLKCFLQSSCMI